MAAVPQAAATWQTSKLPKIAYGKGSYLYDAAGKLLASGRGTYFTAPPPPPKA